MNITKMTTGDISPQPTTTDDTIPTNGMVSVLNNSSIALATSAVTSSTTNANFMNATIINTVNGLKSELVSALNNEASGDAVLMDKENVSGLNSNTNDADVVVKIDQAVR